MSSFWYTGVLYYDIGNNELRVGTGKDSNRSPNALSSADVAPENLIIPSYISEKTVTQIGRNSFSSCTNIKTVDIGRTINKIGEYAFEYCTSLERFTIQGPSNVIIGSGVLATVSAIKVTVYFGGIKHQTNSIFYQGTGTPTIIVSNLYKYNTFGLKDVTSHSFRVQICMCTCKSKAKPFGIKAFLILIYMK